MKQLTIKFLLGKFIIYFICTFSWSALSAQNNISVIDSLIGEIITEEVLNPENIIGDSLTVFSPDSVSRLIRYTEFTLTNMLQNSGFKVYRNSIGTGNVLEIAHVSVSIKYSEPYSNSFFSKDLSKRDIVLKFIGQIRSRPSGQVVKSITSENYFSDEINYNNIEELEASSYSFTQGERQRYSGWDRIIEPAIIITSVVVLVLLFFTQRA